MKYDYEIIETIKSMVDAKFRDEVKIYIRNSADEKSIVSFATKPSFYTNGESKNYLICHVKQSGKIHFVSFPFRTLKVIEAEHIPYTRTKSSDFLRIDFEYFFENWQNESLKKLVNASFMDAISTSNSFGCCSKYASCEQEHRCLHDDKIYSLGCQWRKLIEK